MHHGARNEPITFNGEMIFSTVFSLQKTTQNRMFVYVIKLSAVPLETAAAAV